MTISIRPARPEEMSQLGSLTAYVYGGTFGDGPDNIVSQSNQPEWTLCAFDGDRMAASFVTIPFTMRAAGKAMKMGGISAVGTLPEYRRRGLLRRLMTDSLVRMHDAGIPMAALWASQAAIYQRYGFAMATVRRHYRIDSADIGFFDGDNGTCPVERVSIASGFDDMKQLYIRFIERRLCYLHRARPLWQLQVLNDNTPDGPVNVAIAWDDQRRPAGYIVYTLRAAKLVHPTRSQELKVRDFVWTTPDAYRSLWRFLASHDLVGAVDWGTAPMDDPARELFAEPRLLNAKDNEGCWFRIVDFGKAMEGRGYLHAGSIRIAMMDDELAPWNNGTWQVDIEAGVARARKVEVKADLTVSVKSMTSILTGARRASDLSAAALASGDPVNIALADKLFATPHAPHCPDNF